MISKWWIGKDIEGSGRCLILKYYPGIYLEVLEKNHKKTSVRDIRYRGRDLNPRQPEYETEMLNTRRRPVFVYNQHYRLRNNVIIQNFI
jgi:hypothetical protein